MASPAAEPDRVKTGSGSIPHRKARIIARIRAFTDFESRVSSPWISVHKSKGEPSDRVKISFVEQPTSRKELYEIDYCYEQTEDNSIIFEREIKPLISEVFNGSNSSVFAYGARGSGKTYTIQGSDENPGLAAMAMSEILPMAEKSGKSVTISLYVVFQDHVYDMLDPKRSEVLIMENGQGKIQLKGLSQVPVVSISEFQRLYFSECSLHKSAQKIPTELLRRSHRGLMVHVSSCYENKNAHIVGKMNFVDLAGYEDVRRKSYGSVNLAESTRINKSLYALHNVVHALNANENHVPYRESKLTRMLQDSLRRTNRILMVTCMNPSSCLDTICMVNLASRACQGISRVVTDSTKKTKSSAGSMLYTSSKKGNPGSLSSSARRQTGSRVHFSEKKVHNSGSALKGRKLFDEVNHSAIFEKAKSSTDIASITKPSLHEMESLLPIVCKESNSISAVEKETFISVIDNASEASIPIEHVSLPSEHNHLEVTSGIDINNKDLNVIEEGKENIGLLGTNDGSPPLSARLRELSNNLKSLYSSTPLCIKLPQESELQSNSQVSHDSLGPRTPIIEHNMGLEDNYELSNISGHLFSARNSGVKKSIVQDFLQFLNSATKEELKEIKGIGEKRATNILELREESPEPFKSLGDLKDIGLSAKQIKGMMKNLAGSLFD